MTEDATANPNTELPATAMLGVGSMGGAILSGLRNPDVHIVRPVVITTRSVASAQQYAGAEDLRVLTAEADPEANRRAVAGAKIVILGVKPWMVHDLVREISGALEPGMIVVSLAAGVTSSSVEELLPQGVAFVRAMPNTPTHIGKGVTGIAAGATAAAAELALVRRLFETVGEVLEVGEHQINDIAAVSGSGPAYLYYFAEEMTEAAKRRGFDEDQARVLVQQTILGAATLMRASDESPAQLRRNVTSPNGTTEQAMGVLMAADWSGLFDAALAANVRRSQELEAG